MGMELSCNGASVFAFGNGTAKGGSPKALMAAYKLLNSSTSIQDCPNSADSSNQILSSLARATLKLKVVNVDAFEAKADGRDDSQPCKEAPTVSSYILISSNME
ncbi:subtilisin-like protease-like protein [Corchorus olitorius]|uniref:Subtilisin-like protease-like protein n=1 Tax=Corchorus olitorius TaxID=93759 RepID=A0A1R3KU44_9ROSI|nr:subtilisin-like protease-like protein [Corchorus olitorius]